MAYSLEWIGQARPQEALNALLGSQAVAPPNPYEPLPPPNPYEPLPPPNPYEPLPPPNPYEPLPPPNPYEPLPPPNPYALPFWFSGQSWFSDHTLLERFVAERDKMLDANRELVETARSYYLLLDLPTLRDTFSRLKTLSFEIDEIRPYSLCTSYPSQTYFNDLLEEMEPRLASLACPRWEPVYSSFSFGNDFLLRKGRSLAPLPYTAPCDFGKDSIRLSFFQEVYHSMWSYSYEEEDLTDEQFIELFDEEACSAWGKQDVQGEPCCTLTTRQENMEALMALPFPRQFLIWTVRYGCHNFLECVAYSASLGYLFQKLLKRFQFILGWAVLRAWRAYKQRRAARFISLALWFAYYKSEGFYPNRVLPFKQMLLSKSNEMRA